MFKKPYLISMLLIAMLVLSACGSTPNGNDGTTEDNNNNDVPDTEVNSTEDDIVEDEESTENDDENNNVEENTQNDEQANDGQEESDDNATNDPTDLKQVDSDAQDYSISIFPEYTLTSEEPGRDSLYLSEDGSIFMRIETTPFDQETYDFFKDNTVDLLQAVNANGEAPAELTELPQGEGIANAIGYTTNTAEAITSGIVFEKNGLLVRLTIFDSAEENYFDQFIQMGETIVSK